MKPQVTLYTRTGCCLCDDAKQVIAAARQRVDFDYAEIDIDTDAELSACTTTKCLWSRSMAGKHSSTKSI